MGVPAPRWVILNPKAKARRAVCPRARPGRNIRGTRRLTLDGNAGISIINPRQSGAATVGGSSGSDVSVGFVGDLSLTYTPWADTIDSRQAWTLSPTYNYALTRDWDLALSYQWTKTDTAQSNTALLTLSHRGAILP
jgi:hypothetical protein